MTITEIGALATGIFTVIDRSAAAARQVGTGELIMLNPPLAIIVAGALIALAIGLTNHWEVTTSGEGTYRLNRWTGAVSLCLPRTPADAGPIDTGCSYLIEDRKSPAAATGLPLDLQPVK